MKYFTLLVFLLLSGCAAIGIQPDFPEASVELMKPCELPKKIEQENVSILEMLKVVATNYTASHECAAKVEHWQNWYTEQKKIYSD